MSPKTGEMLAMATKPDFDLNSPFEINIQEVLDSINALPQSERSSAKNTALQKLWKNKAVTDTYEPGSVFKILTYAMALEEGVVRTDETFNCTGVTVVGGHSIHCWKREGHGIETLEEGLQNSCNPVLMELGRRLGVSTFCKYFSSFGMDARTGFDIVGESSGVFFKESAMHEVELATCSFGQSFQVTPLQLCAAVSAIVNGGNLMRPHIVKQFLDSDGDLSFAEGCKLTIDRKPSMEIPEEGVVIAKALGSISGRLDGSELQEYGLKSYNLSSADCSCVYLCKRKALTISIR
jgi:stage V sporulation protein D (sporulation-specific penicillin-binding protein)